MATIFLSYTSADKSFVERLSVDLKKAGIGVWYDEWDLKVGDSIVDKIDKALTTNDYFVIVLSPRAVESEWVRRELNASLVRSLSNKRIKILPVLLEPCTIPTIIGDLKHANFTTDYAKGFAQLTIALGLFESVPAYSVEPKSLHNSIIVDDGQYKKLIPFTFNDFPQCLFREGQLDLTIIVGGTDREHLSETEIFNRSIVNVELFGTKWSFSRQVSPGSVRDSVRVADLTAYLGFQLGRSSTRSDLSQFQCADYTCLVDVSVPEEALQRNLILVGGADTNVFIAIATIAFRQRFGYALPIRYFGDNQLYFTCDQIFSEPSGKTYSRLEDSSFMHCGYVVMVANPWCPSKVMVLVVGTRATGTQAALLSLIRGNDSIASASTEASRWHSLKGNNRYNPALPAKVVQARSALVVVGSGYLEQSSESAIFDKSRISQRHIINDFEFLE